MQTHEIGLKAVYQKSPDRKILITVSGVPPEIADELGNLIYDSARKAINDHNTAVIANELTK